MSTELPPNAPPTAGGSDSIPATSDPHLNMTAQVAPDDAGERVDKVAARAFPDFSRAVLGGWLRSGELTVDGRAVLPKTKLKGSETLQLRAPSPATENWHSPQPVAFAVVFEDQDVLVVNKPVGLVVHPGAGNFDGTLVNGLLHYRPQLAQLPRAGIVHRLDKDTSGLMVIAASLPAHTALVQAIQSRQLQRQYSAVVEGRLAGPQEINKPISRDRAQPTRQRVSPQGKAALTLVDVGTRFRAHCEVVAQLKTGRTHQIRVHLASIGLPLVGDSRYGAKALTPPAMTAARQQVVQNFKRQALHAQRLAFAHPLTDAPLEFAVAPPADYQALVAALAADLAAHSQRGPTNAG